MAKLTMNARLQQMQRDYKAKLSAPKVPPNPKRNKIKYSCPACFTNIWGKPDLVVLCGTDGETFALACKAPTRAERRAAGGW